MDLTEDFGLLSLENKDKFQRKRVFTDLKNSLENNLELNESTWSLVRSVVFQGLNDSSEKNRELSGQIALSSMTQEGQKLIRSSEEVSELIGIIKGRTCSIGAEIPESSEEVRLLLHRLIGTLSSFENLEFERIADDFLAVCKAGLADGFAEIKNSSAHNIQTFGERNPKDFHMIAPSLVQPLAKNLTHQRKSVRLASLLSLGSVLLHCETESFRSCIQHLFQRTFDPIAEVRLTVSRVASELMSKWRCRQENFALLVPLMITALGDDEIEAEVRSLWENFGVQWLDEEVERDHRLKDLMDFPPKQPEPYPSNEIDRVPVVRPSLGCRLLVIKVFPKLKTAIARDLQDWLVEVRKKSIELLVQVLIHLEDEAITHAEVILSTLFQGIKDGDKEVVKYVQRASSLFGNFVYSDSWTGLVLSRFENQLMGPYELNVLGHIISGSNKENLSLHIKELTQALRSDDICFTFEENQLSSVAFCAGELVPALSVEDIESQQLIFECLILVLAFSTNEETRNEVRESFELMVKKLDLNSKEDLFGKYLSISLKPLENSCSTWGSNSFEALFFLTLVKETPSSSLPCVFQESMQIFSVVLQNTSLEAEMKVKFLLQIAKIMLRCRDCLCEKLDQHTSNRLLSEIILPHLQWSPGNKAAAVRIAASQCLQSSLQSELLTPHALRALLEDLIKKANALLTDDEEKVRKNMAHCLQILLRMQHEIEQQ